MKHSKLLIIADVTDNPYESTSILEWNSFFLCGPVPRYSGRSSLMWGLGVYLTQYCFCFIYICHCSRSLFIVPGSQTKRLAHPEYHFTGMSMAYMWPRVATWKEYPIIPLTLDSGSINGWDTFLGDSRNPKAGRMKSLWNPTINLFFGGLTFGFLGWISPKYGSFGFGW